MRRQPCRRMLQRPGRSAAPALRSDPGPAFHGESATPSRPRPVRLFVRPEPIEAVAEVPDGPPVRFRWRHVLHEVAMRKGPSASPWNGGATSSGTRSPAIISASRAARASRVWLYREGLYRGRAKPQLVPARTVRMSTCTHCSRLLAKARRTVAAPATVLCRTCRHHQFLLPARRLASGRAGEARRARSG